MKVVSHRATLLPAVPAAMARAIRHIADRDGEPVARVVKRLLLAGLAAEGELPPRPKPAGNDAIGVITRINTGSADV
jgi:hypothetical protein